MTQRPLDFGETRAAFHQASASQRDAERTIRDASRDLAEKKRVYQKALARKVLELRAEKMQVSIIGDVARGDLKVADLRFERDVAEGVLEAAVSSVWRHQADRRALELLAKWSQRVAPDGQYRPEDVR